jgi:hypothetical protein
MRARPTVIFAEAVRPVLTPRRGAPWHVVGVHRAVDAVALAIGIIRTAVTARVGRAGSHENDERERQKFAHLSPPEGRYQATRAGCCRAGTVHAPSIRLLPTPPGSYRRLPAPTDASRLLPTPPGSCRRLPTPADASRLLPAPPGSYRRLPAPADASRLLPT